MEWKVYRRFLVYFLHHSQSQHLQLLLVWYWKLWGSNPNQFLLSLEGKKENWGRSSAWIKKYWNLCTKEQVVVVGWDWVSCVYCARLWGPPQVLLFDPGVRFEEYLVVSLVEHIAYSSDTFSNERRFHHLVFPVILCSSFLGEKVIVFISLWPLFLLLCLVVVEKVGKG